MPTNTSSDVASQLAPTPQDSDFALIIAAWPELPAHVRQTIATLIAAAAPGIAPDSMNTVEAALSQFSHSDGPGAAAGAVPSPSVKDRP